MFTKEVCSYFLNFLETDFKRRRIPKRSVSLKDKAGNLVTLRTEKYPSFHRQLIKLIESKKSDPSIDIPRNKFITTVSEDVSDVLISRALKQIDIVFNDIDDNVSEKILNLFLKYEKDQEIFIQESISAIPDVINRKFISHLAISLEGSIKRGLVTEEGDSIELAENLSKFLIINLESDLKEALAYFIVEKDTKKISATLKRALSKKNIKLQFKAFFESFSIKDLHSEIAELTRNKKLAEALELYLYFGEIKSNNRSYPLFFTPISINEELVKNNKSYKLKFEKTFFINKSAIEYTYQEISKANNAAQIADAIGDRICYIDTEETFSDILNDKVESLLSHFSLNGKVDFSNESLNTASNPEIKINNKTSIALFDKADESSINDYEELIGHLDDNSALGEMFSKLVGDFIEQEPESIIEQVLNEWDSTPTSDRLVFSSPIPLNEEQRKILSAVNNPKGKYVTVQGPPGTGKSHTITAILFEAILKNKSVLMLSDKKEALDVVEDKLAEVLNKSRIGDSFQNPILRLGRGGNTYTKILNTQNIENIRTHLRASKEELDEIKPESIEKALKSKVSKYVNKYTEIQIDEIKEYLDLKLSLNISDDFEFELTTLSSKIDGLVKSIETIKDLQKNEVLKSITQFNSYIKLDDVVELLNVIKVTQNLKEKHTIVNSLHRVEFDKKEYVQRSIATYMEIKSRPLAFLLSNFQLREWNENINEHLEFKEYVDFKSAGNIKQLQEYSKLLLELDNDEPNNSLIIDVLNQKNKDVEVNDINKYLEAIEVFNLSIKSNTITTLAKLDPNSKDDIFSIDAQEIIKHIASIQRFTNVLNKLNQQFKDIPQLNMTQEVEQIQLNSTAKMSNIFDNRFVSFVDNNKAKANTLKKMISKKQKFPRKELEQLRNAFPCIIAGIRDYADYVPLEPEIFDLIVIDEASQVSIAQAFPAILRAKKIIVMGDKRQFSNVKSSNASKLINSGYQDNIRESFKNTYGDDDQKLERSKVFDIRMSILEFFENITNYDCVLKKHFRCYPEIISFSSKNFYNNNLQAIKVRAKPIEEVIVIKELQHDGLIEIQGNINKIESDFIVSEIEKISEEEDPPTVGIITPMKDQQKFILGELENSEKYLAMSRLNLKVMTFDSCQGEERDIIFYSFVDTQEKDTTYRVLGSKFDLKVMDPEENLRLQRLNVGMSRAKERIVLVISKPIENFKGNARMILNHYKQEVVNAHNLPEQDELDSPMEIKLLEWIKQTKFYSNNAEKIEIQAQFEVGKYLRELDPRYNHPDYRTDFLMTFKQGDKSRKLIIEYDGFVEHFIDREKVNEFNYSHYYSEKDIEREKILESYGFPFLRINKFNTGKDPIISISNKLESFFLT